MQVISVFSILSVYSNYFSHFVHIGQMEELTSSMRTSVATSSTLFEVAWNIPSPTVSIYYNFCQFMSCKFLIIFLNVIYLTSLIRRKWNHKRVHSPSFSLLAGLKRIYANSELEKSVIMKLYCDSLTRFLIALKIEEMNY